MYPCALGIIIDHRIYAILGGEVGVLGDGGFPTLLDSHGAMSYVQGNVQLVLFQWNNLVKEEEMKGMKWLDQEEGKIGMMDTKKLN